MKMTVKNWRRVSTRLADTTNPDDDLKPPETVEAFTNAYGPAVEAAIAFVEAEDRDKIA